MHTVLLLKIGLHNQNNKYPNRESVRHLCNQVTLCLSLSVLFVRDGVGLLCAPVSETREPHGAFQHSPSREHVLSGSDHASTRLPHMLPHTPTVSYSACPKLLCIVTTWPPPRLKNEANLEASNTAVPRMAS